MAAFAGKKVFVTGGSSGIGLAVARQFAAAGASVWIAARSRGPLESALAEVRAAARGEGGRFGASALDVGDAEAVARVAAEALEGLAGIDIVVNNAGIAGPGYFFDLGPDAFESQMRVNFHGTVHVTRAFLPHLRAQRSGHIANVSSLAGLIGIFGYTAYSASKFAVIGFSDALRQELIPHGIGVSVLCPADTDTPMLAAENKSKPPETGLVAGATSVLSADAVARALLDGIAAGRYVIVPGFMARLAWFLYRHWPWLVRRVMDAPLLRSLPDPTRK